MITTKYCIKLIIRLISILAATTTVIAVIIATWTYIIDFLILISLLSIPVIIIKIIEWAWEDEYDEEGIEEYEDE